MTESVFPLTSLALSNLSMLVWAAAAYLITERRFGYLAPFMRVLPPAALVPLLVLYAAGLLLRPDGVPGWTADWVAAALFFLQVWPPLMLSEQTLSDRRYAIAFAACVFALTLLVSLRLALSALAAWTTIAALTGLSRLKFRVVQMHLHPYDFVFYLRRRANIRFLIRNAPSTVRAMVYPAIIAAAALTLALAIEPAQVTRLVATAVAGCAIGAFLLARANLKRRDFIGHFVSASVVTDFLEAIPQTIAAVRNGGVLATSPPTTESPALQTPKPTAVRSRPPDIILILNESTFPPSMYPSWPDDPSAKPFFTSIDGRTRGLRVETFGGASWITEFSVMTGVPASSYGLFKPHVFHWARGRFRHTLPLCLKRYGYRNAFFCPTDKTFVGTEDFYRSIGIDDVLESPDRERERDSFYFSKTLTWLDNHFATSDRPAFAFVATMSNHHPHDRRFLENEAGDQQFGAAETSIPEEFVRRLRLTIDDYATFRARLAERFPDREFLIVHFGDHQPPLAPQSFGYQDWLASVAGLPTDETAYKTYLAIDAVNFRPRIDPDLPETIEVAHVGTVVLSAAGLPLDAVHSARRELMRRHAGRLFFADSNGGIASQFNRRLIEAGLIDAH